MIFRAAVRREIRCRFYLYHYLIFKFMLNITKGNSIKLRAIFSIDDTPFHVVNSNDLSVRLVSMYRAYECPYRIDVAEDDILYITVPADVSVGVYGLEVKGKLNKMDWRTFTHEVLEITYETVQGDESAVVPASDAYDVKMEVQVNKADEEQQLIEELVRRIVYSGNYIKDKNGITFYNKDNEAVFAVSLNEMEKPDNVRNIYVENGYLVLEFESSQDKKVSISQIFDKTKYYEKTAVDEKFVSASQTLFGRIVEDEDVILKETYPTNPNDEFQICYLSAKGFFAYYDGYSYHTIFKNDYLYNKYLNNFIEPHIGKIFFCAEEEKHYTFKFGQFISLDEEVQGDFVIDENYVHTDNNYTSEEKEKLANLHNYDDATVRQLIADTNANFANYYDKQESYSAVEIDTMLRTQRQGRFVISEELPVASADTMFKIYLIPSKSSKEANVKDEFITLQNGEDEYSWEQVGSTAVDLSGYSTTEEMNTAISAALSSYYSKTDIDGKLSEISTALGERYTKTEIDGKLDNKQDSISDLNDIRSGAAKGSTAYQKPAGGIPASDIASGVLPNVSDKESKMAIVETDSSDTIQAEVGKCYTFSQDVNTLAISLPAPTEKRRIGNIMMYFKTGATPAVTITSEETLLYQDGYKIDANTRYELNCLFNGKEWVVAAMKIGEE